MILIDQLKDIYIDGELDAVETSRLARQGGRKDYTVGLNLTGNAVDDPDQNFYENYACGSERNYTGYCNKELEKLFDKQSHGDQCREAQEAGVGDRPEAAGGRRAADHLSRPAGDLLAPTVKGYTVMVNSFYNGYRFEDVWLDNEMDGTR